LSKLVPAHGGGGLKPRLLEGEERTAETAKAARLKRVPMTSRETSDLIMLGIGAFTPLPGFMGRDDWKGCGDEYRLPSQGGLFWPIPITLSAETSLADSIAVAEEVALWDTETDALMGTMKVEEKYGIDKEHECKPLLHRCATYSDWLHPTMICVPVPGWLSISSVAWIAAARSCMILSPSDAPLPPAGSKPTVSNSTT